MWKNGLWLSKERLAADCTLAPEVRPQNAYEINRGLWLHSIGQKAKTLVINFTANEKPSDSMKPESLLNLFPW